MNGLTQNLQGVAKGEEVIKESKKVTGEIEGTRCENVVGS